MGAILEVYLVGYFQLPVEDLLADGDLKGFLELLNSLASYDLQYLLEVDLRKTPMTSTWTAENSSSR